MTRNQFRSRIGAAWAVMGLTVILSAPAALASTTGTTGPDFRAAMDVSYVLAARGQYAQALAPLRRLYRVHPQHYFLTLRMGLLYYLAKNYPASIRFYRRATTLRPRAVEPWLGLCLPLLAAKKYPAAIKAGRAALVRDPNNATALIRTAWASYLARDYDRAAALYRRVLVLFPAHLLARTGLAWSLTRLGRAVEAKIQFTRVLQVSPRSLSARRGSRFLGLGPASARRPEVAVNELINRPSRGY